MSFEIQKAALWKRAAAFLVDMVCMAILMSGLLSALSSATGYDGKAQQLEDKYNAYAAEYGVSLRITEEEFNAMSKEDQEKFNAAYEALTQDAEALEIYQSVFRLSLICLSLSIFIAVLLVEFIVPLLLKEGRTLGKRIFGLCVVHTNCVRMNVGSMLLRSLLGKYAIEIMAPVLIMMLLYYGAVGVPGAAMLMVLVFAQIIIIVSTKNNQLLHDLLAQSVVADYQSQPIYASLDELNASKAQKASKAAKLTADR